MNSENNVIILGAGLSGLTAAYHLKKGYEIFEKEDNCGGLCRSRSIKGFTFDIAGHLLHFKDSGNLLMIKRLLGDNVFARERSSWIWSCRRFIPYPFQSHLYSLPARVREACLAGFKKALSKRDNVALSNGLSFKAWVLATFGEGVAKYFMLPYNEKFWKFPLERLNHDWAREWIPVPTLQDVCEGAAGNSDKAIGYNATFWYPRQGGIQALPDALGKRIKKVHTRHEAVRIDLKKKEVLFRDGVSVKFKKLISTLPLPELARLLGPLPDKVKKAFGRLRYTSCLNVNLGLSKKIDTDRHWIYFAQKDILFYRLGFLTNFSARLAPQGCSSVYAEISYTRDKPLDKRGILKTVLADCRKPGFCLEEKDVAVLDVNDIKYAYCLYDEHRDSALAEIHSYLKTAGVSSIGRYGGWRYASMEDVMAEARQAAEDILKERC